MAIGVFIMVGLTTFFNHFPCQAGSVVNIGSKWMRRYIDKRETFGMTSLWAVIIRSRIQIVLCLKTARGSVLRTVFLRLVRIWIRIRIVVVVEAHKKMAFRWYISFRASSNVCRVGLGTSVHLLTAWPVPLKSLQVEPMFESLWIGLKCDEGGGLQEGGGTWSWLLLLFCWRDGGIDSRGSGYESRIFALVPKIKELFELS